jgi:hypothetical protein
MEENIKITNDIIKAVYAHISKRYNIDNIQVFEFITKQADINNQACNDYILDYYKHFILKPNAISNGIVDKVFKYIAIKTNLSNNKIDELIKDEAIKANKSVDDYMLDYYNNVILKDDEYCNTTLELSDEVINRVYYDIYNIYGMDYKDIYGYITHNANLNNQSREQYILYYYENIKLKDNKNNSVIIEDIDKVNFEELTETDKKVIASRKYMCHEYVKELIRYINKLINIELSNDRHAVDETAVIMYAIQAINRDVVNAVGDAQRILELIKQKQS